MPHSVFTMTLCKKTVLFTNEETKIQRGLDICPSGRQAPGPLECPCHHHNCPEVQWWFSDSIWVRAEEQRLSLLKGPLSTACSLVLPIALAMTLLLDDSRPACFSAILGPSFFPSPTTSCLPGLLWVPHTCQAFAFGVPSTWNTPSFSLQTAHLHSLGLKANVSSWWSVPDPLSKVSPSTFVSILSPSLSLSMDFLKCCLSWSLTWVVCCGFCSPLLCENRASAVSFTSFPKHTSWVLQGHLLEDPQLPSNPTLHWVGVSEVCALLSTRSSRTQDRNLGSANKRIQRLHSAIWKGPVPGLFGQMFLGVSHCHLRVHDPGPWQGASPALWSFLTSAPGCAFKWLVYTVELGSWQPHF